MNYQEYYDELKQLLIELCKIPAPADHEDERLAFIANWYAENELLDFDIDDEGNVLYRFGVKPYNPVNIITAHVDTVFPPETVLEPKEEDGALYCPAVGDNTINLAIMMMAVKLLAAENYEPETGLIFAADVGEEGLGNLKGIKAILKEYDTRIQSVTALDLSYGNIINKAVGSKRYEVSIKTDGGHSYYDFGKPNAIRIASDIISSLYALDIPEEGKTTINVGTITGGSSVNTVASSCDFKFEIRSDIAENLELLDNEAKLIIEENTVNVTCDVKLVGDRPCNGNVKEENIESLTKKVLAAYESSAWKEAGYKKEFSIIPGSTDCNASLALGIPSICFGLGFSAGHHSLNEFARLDSLVPGLETLMNYVLQ